MDYLAVLALVVAGWAAVIAWSQLRLQADASGGRGLRFDVGKSGSRLVDRRNGVTTTTEGYRVIVELFGPGVRHQVDLHLERDGWQLEAWDPGFALHPPSVKRMTCTDPPIVWKFDISPASAADDLWCVLSWIDPRGEHLWTHAMAVALAKPDELYEWRYYRTRLVRRYVQRLNARTKPLGRWHARRNVGLDDGNGPFDLGYVPSTPRRLQGRHVERIDP